ncbi:MAG TPA: efflux RND transporter periplasmic adaptor subunit [Desulfobacteraceae bacterium]|nr:efflux RND transporter periplasmic adaptor subunit [Desulfobacteraceae bacterium]
MKHFIFAVVFLALIAAVPVSGQEQGEPAKVVTVLVREEMVAENALVTGTLHYDTVGKLSAEVSGLVNSIAFNEGDKVNRGDVMVRLNTDFIDKDIELVRIRIRHVGVRMENVEKDLERTRKLFKESSASEKAYDDLRYALRELSIEKEALSKELDTAKLKKAKSVVVAPFDGIVLEKTVGVGDWLAPGAVFCRLGVLDDLCVKVPVSEELVKFTRRGEHLDVDLVAQERTVQGVVTGVLPVADLRTKNVTVKIKLPRIEGAVENMSALVRIPTSKPKKLPLVPRGSVVNFQGKQMVFTIKEGKSAPVPVRVLSYEGAYAAVEGPGVVDGMTVIVDGAERLRPGQPVEVIRREGA